MPMASLPTMPPAGSAPPSGSTRHGRAPALPPEKRRADIAQATLDLLLDRGQAVTTRQIAEAAGIAEGTIFRVFADKEAVLQAAVDLCLDPAPLNGALAAIDQDQPFDHQLAEAVAIIQARIARVWKVLNTVGSSVTLPERPPELPALLALFEPQADRLRCTPVTAARQMRALTGAMSHPTFGSGELLPPTEIVSLLLDGIRSQPQGDPS